MSSLNNDYNSFECRDEFKRKPIAEKVAKLLISNCNISPMLLHGGWGIGKTEFCHKLLHLIDSTRNNNHKLIYIDALHQDAIKDPFYIILKNIATSLKDNGDHNSKDFIEKVAPYFSFGLKLFTREIASRLVKQDLDRIVNDVEEVTNLVKLNSSLFKLACQQERKLNKLKNIFKEFVKTQPMIIFIDELDRCRPDFAIDILETIKHVFTIENLKFVLIANKKQLTCSLSHRYGNNTDTKNYLDKFIKFTYTLPVSSQKEVTCETINNSIIHCRNLTCEFNAGKNADILFQYIIETFSLSLREVENLVDYFNIYSILSGRAKQNLLCDKGKEVGYIWSLIIAIAIVCIKPELSQKIINKSFNYNGIYVDFFSGDNEKIDRARKSGGVSLFQCAENTVIYLSILIGLGVNQVDVRGNPTNQNLSEYLLKPLALLFGSSAHISDPYEYVLEVMQIFYGNV